MNAVRRFAAAYGVTPQNALVFVMAHEALGLALLVGGAALVYKFQPSRSSALALIDALPDTFQKRAERTVEKGEASVARLRGSARVQWIESTGVVADPVRLGAALVETIVLRKLLFPVLVPAKLYAALKFARRWGRP